MNADKLKKWILSLTDDIEFEYLGTYCSICPFSINKIVVCYGNINKEYTNINDALQDKFWEGKSLEEISEELIYYTNIPN